MSWFLGMLLGAGIALLVVWLRNKGISVKWYEWLMGAVALLLALFAVQHYLGSVLVESEPTAGWMGMLILGGIAVILLAIAWQLIVRRQRST